MDAIQEELTGLIASQTNSHIKILATGDNEQAYTLTIPLMKYNTTTHQYEHDDTIMEHAESSLKQLGLTFDNVNEQIMAGHKFKAYTDSATAKASLTPIIVATRFKLIQTADAKILEKLEGQIIETLPITDFVGNRFNVGFSTTGPDGELVNYRISSLRYVHEDPNTPDTTVSLRYTSKAADNFSSLLRDNESISEEKRAAIETSIASLTEKSRMLKVQELKQVFGYDIDEMIATETSLRVRFKLMSIPNSLNHYLIAEPLDTINKTNEVNEAN